MDKEILIQEIKVPEGYIIDKENSTFERIVFKKVAPTRWCDSNVIINGFYIDTYSEIISHTGWNCSENYNVFATKKQAKSALAMAHISQIMANDNRFGGIITDEEWGNRTITKYVIYRCDKNVKTDVWNKYYHFLAFHTREQRTLFLEENMDLIKQYFMIDD